VAGADHEGGDVVAFEGHLDGLDHHIDVGGVLAGGAHPLGHLGQFHLVAGQRTAVLVEVGPVGIGAAHHHASADGERIGDGTEVEGHPAQVLPRPQREVLVVDEYGQTIFGVHAATLTPRFHVTLAV